MGKNLTSIPGTSGPSHPLQSTQPILGVLEQFWPKNLAEQANPTASQQWVRLRAVHLHGGRLHRQQPAGSRIRPGRHARLPQADGRANHRRDSRRGGSAAAWRASAQRVSVGDSSSSAGSFFYIVLGARAESLGLRLSLDSVGGLLRVAMLMLLVVARRLALPPPVTTAPLAFCRNGNPTGGGPLIAKPLLHLQLGIRKKNTANPNSHFHPRKSPAVKASW